MKQQKTRSPMITLPSRRERDFLSFFFLAGICLSLLAVSLFAQAPAKRLLSAEDVYRMQEVDDPQVSPDGKWIAYSVTSLDRAADNLRRAVWMVNWEGAQDLQVTFGA